MGLWLSVDDKLLNLYILMMNICTVVYFWVIPIYTILLL